MARRVHHIATAMSRIEALSRTDLARVCGGIGRYTNDLLEEGNELYKQSLVESDAGLRAQLEGRIRETFGAGYDRWRRAGKPGWIEVEPQLTGMDDPRFHAMGAGWSRTRPDGRTGA